MEERRWVVVHSVGYEGWETLVNTKWNSRFRAVKGLARSAHTGAEGSPI